jgi:hypothetical protein
LGQKLLIIYIYIYASNFSKDNGGLRDYNKEMAKGEFLYNIYDYIYKEWREESNRNRQIEIIMELEYLKQKYLKKEVSNRLKPQWERFVLENRGISFLQIDDNDLCSERRNR